MATAVDPTKPPASQPPQPTPPAPAAPPLPVAGQTQVPPGQPPTQVASSTPATGATPAVAPALPLASAPAAPPTLNASLVNQTITAPQTADRVQLAQNAIDTTAAATDPYYQKSLRDATSQAAGAGQLGSGQLRTSLGDLAQQRGLELDTLRKQAINDATTGSIADEFAKTGIAQQQQGFQAAQAQAGKQNDLAGQQLALAQKAQDQGNTLATGQLDLSKQLGTGQLSLAQQQAAEQNDLAKQQLGLQTTLGTGQLDLARTGQQQQNALATGQLDLSKTLGLGQLDLAKQGQEQAAQQFSQSLAFQQATQSQNHELAAAAQDLQRQVSLGQLSIQDANQKLAELSNQQNFQLNQGGLQLAKNAQDIGVDQFGKQFEAGQQNTAFNQAATQTQIEEALRNGDFSRAMQLLQAGSQGNPSDTALTLAQSYGTQAGQAGAAAGSLLGNATRNAGGVTSGQGAGTANPNQASPIDLSGIDLSGLFGGQPDYAQTPGVSPSSLPIAPAVMPRNLAPQINQLPLAA